MADSIYIVHNTDPDGYDPAYLIGPTVPKWEEYCKSLAPEVVALAIKNCKKGHKRMAQWDIDCNFVIKEDEPVWNIELSYALYRVLLSKGYRKVTFESFGYNWHAECGQEGSGINTDLQTLLYEHNKETDCGV
jgi:hypothetical protein